MSNFITLRDDATGAVALVAPQLGFNCFRFTVPCRRQAWEVLWSEPGFELGGKRAAGSGFPILFPFPGRMPRAVFRHGGREYRLTPGDGRGNAIHGFVLDRPWRIVDQSSAHVTGEFQATRDDPTLVEQWPGDFAIRMTWRVTGRSLAAEIAIANPGDRPLPCGLGLHPYFRVPLGDGQADDCRVQVPAAEYWELREMIASGRRLPLAERCPLATGMPFAATQFDDVLTGLEFHDGNGAATRNGAATLTDAATGRRLEVEFSDTFRQLVIYNPPHREAICLEPYTCVPGAIHLHEQGVDIGWQELPPAATLQAHVTIRCTVEPASD